MCPSDKKLGRATLDVNISLALSETITNYSLLITNYFNPFLVKMGCAGLRVFPFPLFSVSSHQKLNIMTMNRLLLLLTSLVAILSVGCTHDTPEPTPEPMPEDYSAFEVTIESTTRSTVTFSVEPKDLEAEYLCVIYEKADADEYAREEFLLEAILMEVNEEASAKGKTFVEYMSEVVDRGKVEDAKFSGLNIGAEYYIIVFGVDAENGYRASTKMVKKEFATEGVSKVVCDFRVSTEVTDNSVSFSVNPTDEKISWYLCTMPVEQYNYYVVDEDGYQMSEDYFYEYYFQQDIYALLGGGMSESEVAEALIHEGALSLEAHGLKENTDYYFLIAGLIADEEGIVICTDVQRGEYTTGAAARSDMTFEIEILDIGQMEASFRITPSTNDKYCALVAPWDGVTEAQDMMHKIVDQWGGWMDMMANDRGMVEHVGAGAMKLPAADTDYYIIAFGYDGGITTDAYMKTFRTLPGGSLDEVVFEVTASNISPYGFNMNVKSSDATIYYVPGICVAEEYDETTFVGYENEAFNYYFSEYKNFNPAITVAEILDQYYYNGNNTLQVSGLQPDTEYMAYIYALDVHTGQVVKCFTFPAFASTSQFSTVSPQIELVGYYSGDDENGAIFNDASATRGRAITVVKYSGFDNVRTLFSTMVEGDCSNAAVVSDGELWQLTQGHWDVTSMNSPYTFYLADWNVEQTALCYATDNSGMVGPMSRLYTCPTADNKSDISELKALVDELNAVKSQSYAVPVSIVIGGSCQPVIMAL